MSKRTDVSEDSIRELYEQRVSVLEMSRRLGLARVAIVARMKRMGLAVRGGSEANRIRFEKAPETRRAVVQAAHRAARGSRRTTKSLSARAAHIERLARSSDIELVFAAAIRAEGHRVVPQMAVGIWNIDLAVPDQMIAVEIDPGNWHSAPHKRAADLRKDQDLRASGWRVVRFAGRAVSRSNPTLWSDAQRMVRDSILVLR